MASRGRAVSAGRRGVSLGDDDNVLAFDSDGSCRTLWVYRKLLNYNSSRLCNVGSMACKLYLNKALSTNSARPCTSCLSDPGEVREGAEPQFPRQ